MSKPIVSTLTAARVKSLKKEDAEKYANLPDEGTRAVSINYPVPEDVISAAELFTEKTVLSLFIGHMAFTIQGKVRNQLISGLAEGKNLDDLEKEIQNSFYDGEGNYNWKPSDSPTRKSGAEKEKDRIAKLSPEQQAAEVTALKAMLASLEG